MYLKEFIFVIYSVFSQGFLFSELEKTSINEFKKM